MDLNIQIDAGDVTGGLDGAVSALERIKRLVESTEPFGTHLAKGSKVEVDSLMAQMRRLVEGTEGGMRRIEQAMRSATPADMRREIERLATPMRQLVQMAKELSGAKFSGLDGVKAAAEVNQVVGAVRQASAAYDKLKADVYAAGAAADATARKLAAAAAEAARPRLRANLPGVAAGALMSVPNSGPQIPRAMLSVRDTVSAMEETKAMYAAAAATRAATEASAAAAKAMRDGAAASNEVDAALKKQTLSANDLHSAYRGLASGFGAMWLTWGNALPLLAGAAISHSITSMVKQGAELDHTFKTISALGQVAAQDLAKMNEEVTRLGRSSTYGPQEVAKALETLTLAGLDAKQAMTALQPVLDFSKVGGQSLNVAAETLVAVATAYGYSVEQFSYVGDVIAKTAAISMVSTESMAASFRVASAIAQQYKVSLEDTAVSLALLGQAGIKGQAAGTAVRQMYNELMGSTKAARKALDDLGVSIFDNVNGRMKEVGQIMGELAQGLRGMTFEEVMRALDKLGNERGTKALAANLAAMAKAANETGQSFESEFERITKAVRNSAGFTAEAAREMETSTLSLMQGVGASLETTLMAGFQRAKPAVDAFMLSMRDAFNSEGLATSLGAVLNVVLELGSAFATVAGVMANGLPTVLALGGAFLGLKGLVAGATAAWSIFTGTALAITGVGATAARGLGLITGALGPLGAAIVAVYTAWSILQALLGDGAGSKAIKDAADYTKVQRDRAADYHRQAELIEKGASSQRAAEISQRDEIVGKINEHYAAEIRGVQSTMAQREKSMAGLNKESLMYKSLAAQQMADEAKRTKLLDERSKKVFDMDTEAMKAEAGRQRLSNANQDRQKRELARLNEARGLAMGSNAGSGAGGGDSGREKKPPNYLADETRELQQSQATLKALEAELLLRKQFPETYDGMTEAEKKLYAVREQLNASTVDGVRSMTNAERAAKLETVAVLEKRVAVEQAIKAVKEENDERKKAVELSKSTTESIRQQADQLTAANATFGMSKTAIGAMTLSQMEAGKAMGAQIKVGKDWVTVTDDMIEAQKRLNEQLRGAEYKKLSKEIADGLAASQDQADLLKEEAALVRLTALERAKVVALQKVELDYRKQIRDIDNSGLLDSEKDLLRIEAAKKKALDASNAVSKVIQDDFQKTADQANQALTDALLRGFEDGKGFGKNFVNTLENMFKTTVLKPVISFIVNPIGNAISGIVSGFLGGGQGGAGGIGGMLSNGNSLLNLFTGNSGGVGSLLFGSSAAYGLGVPGVSLGSQQAAMLAAQTGPFGWGGLSSTASAANISGASWMSSAAAGLAVVAAPLIIGALAESRTRDRFSGAAFATSNFGKDPTVTIGGADYDPIKGILPDRDALVGRALEAGISQEMIDRFKDKDRALLHYIRMLDSNRQSGNEGPPINVNALLENDNMYAADWYRGQGYTHPEAMGWWNDKGYDLASNDPAVTTASRAVATSIVGPLTEINRILGGAADDFRVTAGYATRGEGKGVWAGLNISQGENNLVDWVNKDDFRSPQEAVKGMYDQALGALEKLDLPKWAKKQVDGAQAQLAALTGDKVGEQAAAIFSQTTAGIAQMYQSIKMLIAVFPDFKDATQDSVFALQELMGGMQNLQSAYSSYMQNFWGEEERKNLARKQLRVQLADAGFDMPNIEAMKGDEARRWFRAQVEAQDLSTESGRKAFAALMGLADAFAQLTPELDAASAAAQTAADAQRKLQETYDAAKSRTDQVWSRLQDLFNEQIDNWKKLADEARAIFDMASSAARELRNEVPSTLEYTAAQSNSFIDQALAGLRATGALPEADSLRLAIDGARGGLSMDNYASVAEYERDKLILAGKLGEIGDTAGVQLSFAEQQVQLLEQQRDFWRKQLDAMRDDTLLFASIDEGVTALADAMRAEQAAKAAIEAAQKPSTGGGRGVFGGGGGGPGRTPGQIAAEAEALRGKDWWGKGDWSRLLGYRLDAAAKATGISPDDLAKYLAKRGMDTRGGIIMPRYAAGGMHPGGLRVVGERGWELEATGPSRIWNQQQLHQALTGGGSNDAELADLLRQVLRELGAIRADTKETSDLTYQQLSLNKRLTSNGSATRVEVLTP